jgi:hypothetical protein
MPKRTIIVTARPPKPRKPKAAAAATRRPDQRQEPRDPQDDPKAEERVREFFDRMVKPV